MVAPGVPPLMNVGVKEKSVCSRVAEVPLRSRVPLLVGLPESLTGALEFPPPQPTANAATAPSRIKILRMPEHKDGLGTETRSPTNPLAPGGRRYDVWEVSDEALVAGLAVRDGDAALAFVRRFQRRVFGCALAIVGDAGRAEDVAQEAFVRAWRHAAVYDTRRASVATWLLTITRNLAIDAVRVERVRPSDPVATIDLTLVERGAGPADLAVRSAEVEHVMGALRDLPTDQRRAVVLASVHGRTALEISEIEGIPLGTAKTRLRTGLLKLRSALIPDAAT